MFDTTRAWFHFLRAIVSVMKRGYKCSSEIITDDGASVIDLELAEEFSKLGGSGRDRYTQVTGYDFSRLTEFLYADTAAIAPPCVPLLPAIVATTIATTVTMRTRKRL